MKKLILLTLLLIVAALGFADIIIGNGTSLTRYPGSSFWNYYRSANLFLGSELNASTGTITNLQWYCSTSSTTPMPFKIYLKTTTATTCTTDTWANYMSGAVEVFNSTVTVSTTGWYDFNITDTAYTSGTNLMVLVETGLTAYTSPYHYWNYTATTTNLWAGAYADGTIPASITAGTSRPNIKLVGISTAVFPEPSNHVTDFAAGTLGYTSIPLNWTGSTGAQLPGSYLIQAIKTGGSYAAVADGTPVANDAVWTDNNAAINVAHVVGANTYTFTGLSPNTAYEFKIWPYTNSLTDINFKTDGTIPTVNATTLDATVTTFPYNVDFSTWQPTNWTQYNYVYGGTPVTGGSWIQDDWLNITSPVNKAAKINIYYTHNSWLVTPPIQIPATGYELKFDLALMVWNSLSTPVTAGNQADDRLLVVISNNPDMTSPTTLMEWNNTGSANVFDNIPALGGTYTINLDGYVGTKYIGFYAESLIDDTGDNDLMVDNVIVRETPAAPIFIVTPTSYDYGTIQVNYTKTQNFVITNNGGGSLGISSIAVTTGSEYYAITYDQGNTPLTGGQSRTFTVTYTAPATEGGPYAGVVTITDDRAVTTIDLSGSSFDPTIMYADLPYATSFEDAWVGTPPAPAIGWSVVNANADSYTWRRGATYIPANTGTVFAQGMGNTNDWMITPPISTGVTVRLKWYDRVESATYPNSYKVLLSTTNNQPASFTTELADITCNWLTWTEHTLTFNNTSGTAYIAFHQYASGSTYYDFGIDDLTLEELPGGPPSAPTLTYPVALTGLPQVGFNLTWTPDPLSGPIDYYNVFFWTDDQSLGDGPIWSTTGTSLNPCNPPLDPLGNPQDPIVFNYLDRYNWTVEAYSAAYPLQAAYPEASWFEIQSDHRINIPHYQDFGTTLTWPLNWTQSYTTGGANVWAVTATANAGGTADEMTLTWVSGTFISRLITPPINTEGVTQFQVNFAQMYDGYGAGITAKLQYSHDLVTWYDTSWSIVGSSATVGPNLGSALISGLTEPVTYVAWALDGNHYQVDYWYVDNVELRIPPQHDVGVVSWDYPREVVPENTLVTPAATVANYGLNPETFTVNCTIGTYSETQTVTNLGAGLTQPVTFPQLTPALWSAENVVITTTLATDEIAGNNTFYSALICLDLDTPALANNAQTDQFVQFNLATPGTLNPLPTSYTGTYFMSGGDWMNGNWMAVEYDDGTLATDNYYEIDPLTGTYLPSLGEPGAALMGIAYEDNGTTGNLYGVGGSNGTLYTMDPVTGLATAVAVMWYDNEGTPTDLPTLGGLMIDCAYDNLNDVLYGIDLGNDCLWSINTTTAELTFIGYFGVDLNYAQDAAFDQDNGLLFLCGYSATGALYWIDTVNGGAYQIGLLGTTGYELDAFTIPYGIIATPAPVAATTGQITWPSVAGAVQYKVLKSSDPYGTYAPYATVYGTSWTDPLFSEGMAFYKVVAVGGVRNTHKEVRFSQPLPKAGQLGLNKRVNTGNAW